MAMTKDKAKKLTGTTTDADLAKALGISQQAIAKWPNPIPKQREWQILAMPKTQKRRRAG